MEEEGTTTRFVTTLPSSLGEEASPSFPSTSSSSSSTKRRKDIAILHRLLLRPLEGPALFEVTSEGSSSGWFSPTKRTD
ncbi:UNVERIFIED_CONTAM: hypothetical protein Slati_4278500 [Sesamum latifolium]|uniref:Uncharacterized protein n=1 Tax=Sesamum latifolium TaxID=2727402 RepID=A0AAW2TCM1_9LAMI